MSFKILTNGMHFSFQFRKIISHYKRIKYNLNVLRQSACLVFNPILVDNYAAFFKCTPVGRASDSMMVPTSSYLFKLFGTEVSFLLLGPSEFNLYFSCIFLLLRISVGYSGHNDLHRRAAY